MLSRWASRLQMPRSSAARSGVFSSVLGTPPLYFRARTVATITMQSGDRPALRHLMSINFSAPRSAPKPASVIAISASRSASLGRPARCCSRVQCWRTGPPVHQRGRTFQRLHQIGLDGVLHQRCHRAFCFQVTRINRLAFIVIGQPECHRSAFSGLPDRKQGTGSP